MTQLLRQKGGVLVEDLVVRLPHGIYCPKCRITIETQEAVVPHIEEAHRVPRCNIVEDVDRGVWYDDRDASVPGRFREGAAI